MERTLRRRRGGGLIENKRYVFGFEGVGRVKQFSLKDLYLKKKNLSLYKENGDFAINNEDLNFIKFHRDSMKSERKWKLGFFKRQYLRKFRYKRRNSRIKNYIQKNIISKKVKNYFQVLKIFRTGVRNIYASRSDYILTSFELLNIKLRFLQKYINLI
jgi:hypothetical protein